MQLSFHPTAAEAIRPVRSSAKINPKFIKDEQTGKLVNVVE